MVGGVSMWSFVVIGCHWLSLVVKVFIVVIVLGLSLLFEIWNLEFEI